MNAALHPPTLFSRPRASTALVSTCGGVYRSVSGEPWHCLSRAGRAAAFLSWRARR